LADARFNNCDLAPPELSRMLGAMSVPRCLRSLQAIDESARLDAQGEDEDDIAGEKLVRNSWRFVGRWLRRICGRGSHIDKAPCRVSFTVWPRLLNQVTNGGAHFPLGRVAKIVVYKPAK